MEKQGVIEQINHSEWAAPILAVPKKDGHSHILVILKSLLTNV